MLCRLHPPRSVGAAARSPARARARYDPTQELRTRIARARRGDTQRTRESVAPRRDAFRLPSSSSSSPSLLGGGSLLSGAQRCICRVPDSRVNRNRRRMRDARFIDSPFRRTAIIAISLGSIARFSANFSRFLVAREVCSSLRAFSRKVANFILVQRGHPSPTRSLAAGSCICFRARSRERYDYHYSDYSER